MVQVLFVDSHCWEDQAALKNVELGEMVFYHVFIYFTSLQEIQCSNVSQERLKCRMTSIVKHAARAFGLVIYECAHVLLGTDNPVSAQKATPRTNP